MKLILTGATGFVGGECLRLALKDPAVTEVIALARRDVTVPDDADKTKFKSVILKDWEKEYPEDVKEHLRNADACIWNLALSPAKAQKVSREESRKTCLDLTLTGMKSMMSVANPEHPFRFVYTSGSMTERDQNRSLWLMPEYRKMRGEVENQVLAFAANSGGRLEAQVTKPGRIDHSGRGVLVSKMMAAIVSEGIHVSQLAAVELDQASKGFEKDTLENVDLVRIGNEALKKLE